MVVAIIALAYFVGVLLAALYYSARDRRQREGAGKSEITYQVACGIAPRKDEDENWQMRVVFTTPAGCRCQYYVEVDAKESECEAVKIAFEQTFGFLRSVNF